MPVKPSFKYISSSEKHVTLIILFLRNYCRMHSNKMRSKPEAPLPPAQVRRQESHHRTKGKGIFRIIVKADLGILHRPRGELVQIGRETVKKSLRRDKS